MSRSAESNIRNCATIFIAFTMLAILALSSTVALGDNMIHHQAVAVGNDTATETTLPSSSVDWISRGFKMEIFQIAI